MIADDSFDTDTLSEDEIFQNPLLKGTEFIEKKIGAYHAEFTEENHFAVVDSIRKRMHADGHFIIPIVVSDDGDRFAFHSVQTKDGAEFIAVFTSKAEYEKGNPSRIISNFIDWVLKISLDTDFAGLVINPWGQSFMLPKEMVIYHGG